MSNRMFVVQRARVFDGEEVIASASVLVQDRLIAGVAERIDPPAEASVIDGRGMTLIPELIDAHRMRNHQRWSRRSRSA
ncbi:MAG: hypothetical protein JOZ29_14775 [Deltaproteobacteria bacterium]|nr:hypothetical protein [Deltaproteobacteria bacterium]MBV8453514.1 hypothetical protein [Deltaproteobacteria bacterium]